MPSWSSAASLACSTDLPVVSTHSTRAHFLFFFDASDWSGQEGRCDSARAALPPEPSFAPLPLAGRAPGGAGRAAVLPVPDASGCGPGRLARCSSLVCFVVCFGSGAGLAAALVAAAFAALGRLRLGRLLRVASPWRRAGSARRLGDFAWPLGLLPPFAAAAFAFGLGFDEPFDVDEPNPSRPRNA